MAATLSDHASVWMGDALRMNAEITLDQPNQGAARIFARQLYTLHIHLCEGRALALVRGAWKHGDCYTNGISRRPSQGAWLY